jgi:hypothetical protein
MTLDKAIQHGEGHRCEYRGAKAAAKSCRNNGSCPRCYDNRTYKNKVREPLDIIDNPDWVEYDVEYNYEVSPNGCN